MTLDPGKDLCLGFFAELYNAGRVKIPHGARVLEVGCAENDALTPLKRARPDLHLTGLDWRRPEHGRPGADVIHQGNLMDPATFPPVSFDVILAISVIEHVGIGRYGDPRDEQGDRKAMVNLHWWLKPDGVLYLDVPYRGKGQSEPFRAYNEADLQARVMPGWHELDRQEFKGELSPGKPNSAVHRDAPYIALVLKP